MKTRVKSGFSEVTNSSATSMRSIINFILQCLHQNRRQKVFNRGLCVSAGRLWVCSGGLEILKTDKNSTGL